ncbi:T9SS type A sorting domain-containing protein [Flavobacterium sp. DGU11]|uniref:T9SS type A sorting domain-containing protein n=1 Tax=Flavobacterium arundinis TaxID=3139143 RepID=A0ABU9HYW7_9FLAO
MKSLLISALFVPLLIHAQNTCETAIAITPGIHTTGTIDGTNYDAGCWNTTGLEGAHAEWYAYSPESDGMARITTNFPINDGITLSNNIQVSVYSGSCDAMQCHAANGAIGMPAPFYADIEFEVRTGTVYYIAFDDQASNKALQFELTLAVPDCETVLPFTENWATHLDFTCWKTYGGNGLQRWLFYDAVNLNEDPAHDPVAVAYPSVTGTGARNEWLVSPQLNLDEGTTYTISVKYNALYASGITPNESFRTVVLDGDNPASAVQTELGIETGITQHGAFVEPYNMDLATTVSYSYTPETTGGYFLGLHTVSPEASGLLVIYEVKAEVAPLSVENFSRQPFRAYPNPVKDRLTIASDGLNIESAELIDSNGRLLKLPFINNEFDMGGIAAGAYFLKVISDKGFFVEKIIKE